MKAIKYFAMFVVLVALASLMASVNAIYILIVPLLLAIALLVYILINWRHK